jgi:ribosome biogenesis GTPase / thiamine phosphate phosphatase
MELTSLGWNSFFAEAFASRQGRGWVPARVTAEDKHAYVVVGESGELTVKVPGRLLHGRASNADLPKVGDWVAVSPSAGSSPAMIQEVLPRRTRLARKVPGREVEVQVLAANMDLAFVVQGLDQASNLRRQERFLAMVHEGGASPVLVLNKADLCRDAEARARQAQQAAGSAPVLLVSARTGRGLKEVRDHLRPGATAVFIGPSGVGKSSLINRLYGEEIQATIEVRESDAKGRHSTTWRELIQLPWGGLVIDTPGMREAQIGAEGSGIHETFPDIVDLAVGCHFRDCSHTAEQRCAVQAALAAGRLERERYQSFLKLRLELDYMVEERRKHTYLARRRESRQARRSLEDSGPRSLDPDS